MVNIHLGLQARRVDWLLLLYFLAGCAITGGGSPLSYGRPNFEYTGTVYDAETKLPIEGAYVVASYREDVGPQPAFKSWCVKTLGMYTGKDGKYHFPIESLDGQSPYVTSAIKPGYYLGDLKIPRRPADSRDREKAAYWSGRDLILRPQGTTKPTFDYSTSGDERCSHAKTKEDAAAGAEFLRIELGEKIRLGASEQVVSATKEIINYLETLPSELVRTQEKNAGGQR